MDIPLSMSAELSGDEVIQAIKDYVERKSGMVADKVTLHSTPDYDYLDRRTGGNSISATVTLKKNSSNFLLDK